MNITAKTARKANGWHAVLEFSNGGRQVLSSLHWNMASAQIEANHALMVRLKYPDCVIRNPKPNECMELGT